MVSPGRRAAWPAPAGVSPGVVQGLVEAGTLETVDIPPPPVALPPDPDFASPALNDGQATAAEAIRETADDGFSVTLIDGVTGSGKTEVYFEAIAETLRNGGQVLILLPEIALTADFLDRFAARFGQRPGEWHSDVAPRNRERLWRGVANGSVRVVVGARSALFLPFPDLRLVIVDEEHDPAYKQEDGVAYHARDMAVVRGRIGDFPVILSSATPSIESRVNADIGRYRRIELPDRYAGAHAARRHRCRPPRRTARTRALAVAAALPPQSPKRSPASSNRCSSSTGAATLRSRSAAPAAIASSAQTAPPGWSSTASAASSSAIIAAIPNHGRRPVPVAATRTASSPAAPASNASQRKSRNASPMHACRSCRAT